ncbi:serine/threonine-protein kinase [Methanoculleus frigidifontis]|uniref:serine/threonine-protein kinase n=1 Tax=Methanoculleus frigidifontis TaxID=2584085 RepID=UPI00265A860B|nr:serine/threonine-protein kinase [Methanoculleus sp. FWC-SCC1]
MLYKYRLCQRIGGGFFGEVWLAHDIHIDRDVAVKIQVLSEEAADDVLQEAQIGNHLDHRNLVRVHSADTDIYEEKVLLLIAMDFYSNGSIINKLNKLDFIPLQEGIRYLIDVLKGLEHLHVNGIYHGDIKPQNILIGQEDEASLTDYGISCYSPELVPVQSKAFYYPHAAPETLSDKQISIQTDIYQVGMTAFRLLNGEAKLRKILEDSGLEGYCDLVQQGKVIQSCDYLPFIPRNLKMILSKATHVDPSRRYQMALEMRRALERLNYLGYWTCDSEGNLVGYNDGKTYFFSVESRGEGRYNFVAAKREKSGRKVRVGRYSKANVSLKEIEVLKQRYMLFVVTGKK